MYFNEFLRIAWETIPLSAEIIQVRLSFGTARRSNQSILKEISPGISLEGMMLKLKLQYLATSCEELTHWKRLWCWAGLGAGGEGDDWGWDGWIALLTRWTWVWVNSGSWWWTGRPGVLRFMGSQNRTWLSDWTALNWTENVCPNKRKELSCYSNADNHTASMDRR